MTEEEKIAIEYFKEHIAYFQEQIKFVQVVDCDYYDEEYELYKNRVKQFETILNLIQRLQKENFDIKKNVEKKNKMIYLIKNRLFITNKEYEEILKIQENNLNKSFEMCSIQYFEKKVEEIKGEK